METQRQVWDVLVIGAGPAGASAASSAASWGARTVILEAGEPPRYKTCGGGLIGVSNQLAAELGDVPFVDEVSQVQFTFHGKLRRLRDYRATLMRMVNRADFDASLLRHAMGLGAQFVPKARVRTITAQPEYYTVATAESEYCARVVIGADGAESRVARIVGVRTRIVDLGLELELDSGTQAAIWRHRAHLDWGRIPGSYGWLFPKANTLTVGVIAETGDQESVRRYLEELVDRLGVGELAVIRQSGHRTKCREADSPFSKDRILVCGDAAGLLEPWTREGISFAMRSGRQAGIRGAQMANVRLGAESHRIAEQYALDLAPLTKEMDAGFLAREAFEKHPLFFHWLLAFTPFGWKYFTRIASGDTNLGRGVAHASARIPLRILARRFR